MFFVLKHVKYGQFNKTINGIANEFINFPHCQFISCLAFRIHSLLTVRCVRFRSSISCFQTPHHFPTFSFGTTALTMPRSTRSTLKALAIRLLLATALFISPSLYLQIYPELWKSNLHTVALQPSLTPLETFSVIGLSHVSKPKPQPVALCITGHLRSFLQRSIRLSIHRHIIHPLQDTGFAPHVFFHVGLDDAPRTGRARAQRSTWSALSAMREFHPVRISYFSNARLPGPKRLKCKTARPVFKSFPPALLRTEECLDLVAAHEKQKGMRYQWVYKTRPDVAFGSNVSTPVSLRLNTLYMNQHIPGASVHAHPWLREQFGSNASVLSAPVADHVLIAGRETAEIAFRAKDAFRDCRLYQLPSGTLNSEVGVTFWLVINKVRYETMPWFWMLVRDIEGPECHRVQWIRNQPGRHGPNLTEKCLVYKDTGQLPE